MKKLFRGRVRLILLLAVLLAAATALTAALSGTAWGSRTVQAVLTPFRSGFSALTRQAERYYNYLFNYESLSAENDYLRRQISSMENEVRTADSLQRENERLKELLGLQEEHEDYRFNEAYIVSWDSSSWKSTFTIGKGTRSGLETGMVVVLKGAHADVLPESSELLSEEERVSWSETAGLWPEDVRAAYRLPAEALPKLLADCSGIYAFTLSAPVKEAAECIILLAAED